MIKKRRDFNNCEKIEIDGDIYSLADKIAIKTNYQTPDNIAVSQYHLLPKYGTGSILNFKTDEIDITISKYKLDADVVYTLPINKEILQISFLLTGEKIIQLEDDKVLYYENKESYMANIKNFKGSIKILSQKVFKEIKINLEESFLIQQGFLNDFDLKKITDRKLILPITDEIFQILLNLEQKDISSISNKLYLKAKTFELIAIQMEHYKKRENSLIPITQDKTLKKLYATKQLIKSNIHVNYKVNDLGDEIGLPGYSLNKEFIRIFGYSINEYSYNEKMKTAKLMLENTNKLVYQIAEEVGYKNATHFTAAFKRKFNSTPKKYRNEV